MKYKVISNIIDVIAANKNNILCVREASLSNKKGDDPLDTDVYVGMELTDKQIFSAGEIYWHYTRKEWEMMNKEFQKLK